MAKAKSKTRAKAAKVGKALETNTTEMAHKIWLAGVGAYGKAYDTAIAGATTINTQSVEVFEDLVKRGEEIESDVRSRLASDERVMKAGQSVAKAAEAARDFQMQARDQFEARMDRMRDLLGVKGLGTTGAKIARKLDELEDEVAGLAAKAKTSVGDVNLKARIARLTAEIEAVAGEAGADASKAAKKVRKAVGEAMAPVEAKKPAKTKARAKAKAKSAPAKTASATADDLTKISGVGPALVKRLAKEGITTFAQVAALKKADVASLDEKINAKGRIARDEWVKQAKALSK